MDEKKILFVDDEPMVVKLMKTRLKSHNYNVETASSGEEALEKAGAFGPDLILLDIIMPGMDGYQTCSKLKENDNTKDIPVIMFTASQEKEFEQMAYKVGAINIINKPFVADLLESINEVYDKKEE